MLFERLLDIILELVIRRSERRIHVDGDYFLGVGRQCVRDIFERDKRSDLHKESSEQQGRGARPATDAACNPGVRAGVVLRLNGGHFLQDTVRFREGAQAGRARLEAFA